MSAEANRASPHYRRAMAEQRARDETERAWKAKRAAERRRAKAEAKAQAEAEAAPPVDSPVQVESYAGCKVARGGGWAVYASVMPFAAYSGDDGKLVIVKRNGKLLDAKTLHARRWHDQPDARKPLTPPCVAEDCASHVEAWAVDYADGEVRPAPPPHLDRWHLHRVIHLYARGALGFESRVRWAADQPIPTPEDVAERVAREVLRCLLRRGGGDVV